jgi:hypothetical protein
VEALDRAIPISVAFNTDSRLRAVPEKRGSVVDCDELWSMTEAKVALSMGATIFTRRTKESENPSEEIDSTGHGIGGAIAKSARFYENWAIHSETSTSRSVTISTSEK